MACDRCKHLDAEITITLPIHLRAAIALATDNIAAGIVTDISGGNEIPFIDAARKAPVGPDCWGDGLHYRFECTSCGQRFTLYAETYHGQGGKWQAE